MIAPVNIIPGAARSTEYVLLGAVETLKRSNYPPIVFEYNHDSNNNNYQDNQLFHYLKKDLGYNVIHLSGTSNMFLASKN